MARTFVSKNGADDTAGSGITWWLTAALNHVDVLSWTSFLGEDGGMATGALVGGRPGVAAGGSRGSLGVSLTIRDRLSSWRVRELIVLSISSAPVGGADCVVSRWLFATGVKRLANGS